MNSSTALIERPSYVLNDIQKDALSALNSHQKSDGSDGVVVMPTGSGKTFLAVTWFKEQLVKNPEAKLLFICHNKDILSQANEKEFQVYLKDYNLSYGYYHGTEKSIQAQIVFATVQTLFKNLHKFAAKYFDYIIVDEAHHYQALSFKKVIEYFSPKFLLGLTATPDRLDNKNIFEVCGNSLYNANAEFAIKNDILCKFNYYCVDNSVDFSDLVWNGYKYKESDLNRKLCVEEYDSAFLKDYKNLVIKKFKRKKTICFCATVEHAHRMANLFALNGISAVALTGKKSNETRATIQPKKRKQIVKDFSEGVYDIIFVRDLFNEGVNIPNADCIMLMRPTSSKTIFAQQIGRGLRKFEGKSNLLILDFVGNAKKSEINFEYLSSLIGNDIQKEVLSKIQKSSHGVLKKLEILSNGCKIVLNKTKIDLFKKHKKTIYSKNYFIIAYKKVKSLHVNRNIRLVDMHKAGFRHFESNLKTHLNLTWNEFKKMLGDFKKQDVPTKKELLENYMNVKKKLGYSPNCKDICLTNGSFSSAQYLKKFENWRNFKVFSSKYEYCKNLNVILNYIPETEIYLAKSQVLPKKVRNKKFNSNEDFSSKKRDYNEKNKNKLRSKIIENMKLNDVVLLLESYQLLCLKEIVKQKKFPKKIVIVNNDPADTKRLVNEMEAHGYLFDHLHITVVQTSVLQYIADTKERFTFIWLDYCGTFSRHLPDLEFLLRKNFKNLNLFLTYNTRDSISTKLNYLVKVVNYVFNELFDKAKVKIIEDVTYRYKKNMYNVGFEIQ